MRLHPMLREALRVGHCGPLSRILARLALRVPVPGRAYFAYGLLGKPRRGPVQVRVRRSGLLWSLDLRDDSHRVMFLDLYENELIRRALELVPAGGRVVDVGANVGFWAVAAAAHVGPEGAVIAFEPNPWAHAKLLENVSLNRHGTGTAHIDVIRSAVGAERSMAVLAAPDLEALAAQASLHHDAHAERRWQSVEVPVVALDDVATGPIDLLKIDVEGHELAVLAGATGLFRRHPPRYLVTEIHGGNLARAGGSPEQLVSRIESLGYTPLYSDGRLLGHAVPRPLPHDFFETVIWQRLEYAHQVAV